MTTAYQNLKENGWSDEQARLRAKIIDSAGAMAKTRASSAGLIEGDYLACRVFHGYERIAIGHVGADGGPFANLSGASVEFLSLPCRMTRQATHGENDTCTLANGDVFRLVNQDWLDEAGAKVNLCDELIRRTPWDR